MDEQRAGQARQIILVIDDNPDNLRLLFSMLNQKGYDIRPIRSGGAALDFARSIRPDLVLLDIMMPPPDGYAVCGQLKADAETRDIPVIFISALDDVFDKLKAFSLGAVDYITKPFHEEEVLSRVSAHMSLRRMRRVLEEKTRRLEAEVAERKRSEEKIRASMREKEVLLREVHHRVKNNMQTASSLLWLQSKSTDSEEVRKALTESRDRIAAMGLVHEKLYRSTDLSSIDAGAYLTDLARTVFASHNVLGERIALDADIAPLRLSIDVAIPCGLILNELISNALKYAFSGREKGTVSVCLRSDDGGGMRMTVADDGAGLPGDFDLNGSSSLGLKIVRDLAAHQLGADIDVRSESGAEITLKFQDKHA